jgi:glutathione S-transferase
MKLFYSPGACSLAPIILAEWLGIDLELERASPRAPSAALLAVNPLGAVPALQLRNGRGFAQVEAILQYFLTLRPGSGLGGGEDQLDRFTVQQWTAFLTGDFHPPFGGWFNPRRFTTDHSDESLAAVKAAFEARIVKVAGVLDAQVGDSLHIALGRRTLLDAYAYAMLRWLRNINGGLEQFANLQRFMDAMAANPGLQAALAREQA